MMQKKDPKGKLKDVKAENLALYYQDGEEVVATQGNKTLSKLRRPNEQFIVDFKNVIILRLLGGDNFVYTKFDDSIKTKNDLSGKILDTDRE